MIEEVVKLGEENRMVGIFTSESQVRQQAPVVIMFNAGLLHRVGPFRLWVDVARELSKKNIPSLRFDLGGFGDSSLSAQASDSPEERAMTSLVQAMDYVESRMGKRDFILLGLCSGADHAHPAAKLDSRVRGAVMIDGYGYITPGFHATARRNRRNHLLRRSISLRSWRKFIVRKLSGAKSADNQALSSLVDRAFPRAEQVQADIQGFLNQGRRLLFVYTSGLPYFNHENQFWEMFPQLRPGPGLTCHHYKNTDHTFSLISDRKDLIERMVSFISAHELSRGGTI